MKFNKGDKVTFDHWQGTTVSGQIDDIEWQTIDNTYRYKIQMVNFVVPFCYVSENGAQLYNMRKTSKLSDILS